MSITSVTSAQGALEHAISTVEIEFKEVPEGEEMISKISSRFRETFKNPPTKEFEFIFHKNFTDDEVIVALFQPQEEQLKYFPLMLIASAHPSALPLTNLRSLIISLIFLVHRKNWVFMEQFILHGGMVPLSALINDENLYIRGQALETFLSITDCDVFDWFQKVAYSVVEENTTDKRTLLHQQLLSLVSESKFLENLLANRTGSYPGGSCRALQILAFWLSWLRALYTKDQKLGLSSKVVYELNCWSEGSNIDSEGAEDEVKLAKALYEDFGFTQYGKTVGDDSSNSKNSSGDGNSNSSDVGFSINGVKQLIPTAASATATVAAVGTGVIVSGVLGCEKVEPLCAVSEANTYTDFIDDDVTVDTIIALKNKGNNHYKNNQFTLALDMYQAALSDLNRLVISDDGTLFNELSIDLHTNCATAYWKLAQEKIENSEQIDTNNGNNNTNNNNSSNNTSNDVFNHTFTHRELLTKCKESCQRVLQFSPHYTKAVYRLASVYLLEASVQDALNLVVAAIEHYRQLYSNNSSGVDSSKNSMNTMNSGGKSSKNVSNNSSSVVLCDSSETANNIELLNTVRVKCIAALLSSYDNNNSNNIAITFGNTTGDSNCDNKDNVGISTSDLSQTTPLPALTASDVNMSTKSFSILKSLLTRNQITITGVNDSKNKDLVREINELLNKDLKKNSGNNDDNSNNNNNNWTDNKRNIDTSGAILASLLEKTDISDALLEPTALKSTKKIVKSATKDTATTAASNKKPLKADKLKNTVDNSTTATVAKTKKTVAITHTAAANKAFIQFKRNAVQYENKFGSSVAHGEDLDVWSKLVEAGIQDLNIIWSEGSSLNDLFTCSLEECHLLFLFQILSRYSNGIVGSDVDKVTSNSISAAKAITQLSKCERFHMTMLLAVTGNSALKQEYISILESLKVAIIGTNEEIVKEAIKVCDDVVNTYLTV